MRAVEERVGDFGVLGAVHIVLGRGVRDAVPIGLAHCPLCSGDRRGIVAQDAPLPRLQSKGRGEGRGEHAKGRGLAPRPLALRRSPVVVAELKVRQVMLERPDQRLQGGEPHSRRLHLGPVRQLRGGIRASPAQVHRVMRLLGQFAGCDCLQNHERRLPEIRLDVLLAREALKALPRPRPLLKVLLQGQAALVRHHFRQNLVDDLPFFIPRRLVQAEELLRRRHEKLRRRGTIVEGVAGIRAESSVGLVLAVLHGHVEEHELLLGGVSTVHRLQLVLRRIVKIRVFPQGRPRFKRSAAFQRTTPRRQDGRRAGLARRPAGVKHKHISSLPRSAC
eukprot:scaffold570_cov234-Pinguiococcus_pyrenoidosus.AAC.5